MDEGWEMLEQATRRAAELELEAEAARGYRLIGSSASTLIEYERAERWLNKGIEYADRTEQWNHRHYMATHLAHVWWCRGRWVDADRAAQHALHEREGGITTRIVALHVAGFVALGRGHGDAAVRLLEEARAARRPDGRAAALLTCPVGAGRVRAAARRPRRGGDPHRGGYEASHEVADAANLFPFLVTGHPRAARAVRTRRRPRTGRRRCPPTCSPAAIPGTLPAVDHAAGLIQLAAGRTGKARDLLGAARAGWSSRDRWWEAQWCALDLARCALASNRRTEASTLVEGVRDGGVPRSRRRPLLDAARELASRLDEHDAAQPWSPLTLRELEVARLVARGLTNREIAEELRITARTAGSHLEHIRAKLGMSRRSEIAAWVASIQDQDA